jgi:hypothetical protein
MISSAAIISRRAVLGARAPLPLAAISRRRYASTQGGFPPNLENPVTAPPNNTMWYLLGAALLGGGGYYYYAQDDMSSRDVGTDAGGMVDDAKAKAKSAADDGRAKYEQTKVRSVVRSL